MASVREGVQGAVKVVTVHASLDCSNGTNRKHDQRAVSSRAGVLDGLLTKSS